MRHTSSHVASVSSLAASFQRNISAC
jgi:hypothetical protein